MAHRIIDTPWGEVMLKECWDCDTSTSFFDAFIGDNFDEYVGEVDLDTEASDEEIIKELENLL